MRIVAGVTNVFRYRFARLRDFKFHQMLVEFDLVLRFRARAQLGVTKSALGARFATRHVRNLRVVFYMFGLGRVACLA